jgi:predicted DNA-binding transcriptional regulator AlpA
MTKLKPTRPQPMSRFGDLVAVSAITGLSPSTIRRKVADPNGDFPQPVELSERRRGFVLEEIEAWISRRTAARGKKRAAV